MLVSLGCRVEFQLPQPTPLIAMLNVHCTRFDDMEQQDDLVTYPRVPVSGYCDGFGNWCTRMLAPAGNFVLSERAWQEFERTEVGWTRVQAICDYVQSHVRFGYHHANATRTASQTLAEGVGVCRDFAHLAITLSRCMNIPARYCTGYLSDIGEPLPHPAGDFAAWMEVYLDRQWHMFDPRNNARRYARFLVARGRDAADVPLTQTFGLAAMTGFEVWTHEATQSDLSPWAEKALVP